MSEFVEFKQSEEGRLGEEIAHLKKLREDLESVTTRLDKMTWLDSSPLKTIDNVLREEIYSRSQELTAMRGK
jgi:hypothetical protein